MNTVYFVCDDTYFLRFGLALVDSCIHNGEAVAGVVYCTDREVMSTIDELLDYRMDAEFDLVIPPDWVKEKTNGIIFARLYELANVLPRYESVLMLDADALVRQSIPWDIFNRSVSIKLGYKPANNYFSCAEGVIHIRNDTVGNALATAFRRNLRRDHRSEDGELIRRTIDEATNMDVSIISNIYSDFNCGPDGAIWLPLRGNKFSDYFKDEQKRFMRREDHHLLDETIVRRWRT